MLITPLAPSKPRDVALLTPGHRTLTVETSWGRTTLRGTQKIRHALDKLASFACYVSRGVESMNMTTPASDWVMSTWHGSPTSIFHVPSGARVMTLRSTLDRSDDPWTDLDRGMTWLRSYGVSPASISSMAWQMWRASLDRSVTISVDPEISRPAFFGGRQEIRKPAIYPESEAWDIKAAYSTSMSKGTFALSLREVPTSTTIDPEVAGIARAHVWVPPDLVRPPLPVRISQEVIMYQQGNLEGTWTWRELAAAQSLGCEVEIDASWAPAREADLFSSWFDLVSTGRDLDGESSRLAKGLANALWGQFAMTGDGGAEVHWTDDRGRDEVVVDSPTRSMPHQWTTHIAAEVTSRVRTQTLLEAIAVSKTTPIHIDTDGVIIEKGDRLPDNRGDGFGQWRRKEEMTVVDIKAPQVYRFRRPGEPSWCYVAAGLPAESAWRLWERDEIKVGWTSFLSTHDVCLPSGPSGDDLHLSIYLADLERCRLRSVA